MWNVHRLIVVLFLLNGCLLAQTGNISHTAFGVGSTSSLTTFGKVPFSMNMSNVDDFFNWDDTFTVRSTGLHFVYFCVGVDANMSAVVRKCGGYPSMWIQWLSTSHNGTRTVCRGGVMNPTPGIIVKLNYTSGTGIYSSSLMETSFSGFSISDAMNSSSADATLFVTYSSFPLDHTLRTSKYVIINPGTAYFNAADDQYTCVSSGYYMVSFSADIDASQQLLLRLQDIYGPTMFELTRLTTATNGITTLSRSVLFECNTTIRLEIAYGLVSASTNRPAMVSLTVVPYFPIGQSAAWAFYLKKTLTTVNQPETVVFDVIGILNNVESIDNSTVSITYPGTYMVYLSAASLPGQPMNLLLTRNGTAIMGLSSTTTETDGADMMDHGAIVELDAGDVLLVSVQANSAVQSDDGKQVAFWGYLIYGR